MAILAAAALGASLSLVLTVRAAAETPIQMHRPQLPGAVTVWCLGHPALMRTAARARGVRVGDEINAEDITFSRDPMTIEKWARAADAKETFEHTCRTAFVAFSHSSVDVILNGINNREAQRALAQLETPDKPVKPVKVEKTDDLFSLFGVLIGGGITGAFGWGFAHRANRRQDGGALRQLDADFAADVFAHLAARSPETQSRALASARRLRDGLERWTQSDAKDGAVRRAAGEAVSMLKDLLDVKKTPSISNPGGEDERKTIAAAVETIHRDAADVASYVETFARRKEPSKLPTATATKSGGTTSAGDGGSDAAG